MNKLHTKTDPTLISTYTDETRTFFIASICHYAKDSNKFIKKIPLSIKDFHNPLLV